MSRVLHIGIDDTDSPRGGCTTYIAALLVEKFSRMGLTFIDYPNLVRLNPNVPWKTRGNGAVCLRVYGAAEALEEAKKSTMETVEKEADLEYAGTDPGIVFYEGRRLPEEFQGFAKRTIQDVVTQKQASSLIKKFGAEAFAFKEGRGVIGALAAVGEDLRGDHTYEFITYRTHKNLGTPRRVDKASVLRMDEKTRGITFNNVNADDGRILITPRGPDPILYGIRGEYPETVRKADSMIVAQEEVERWAIFRTNQGTDAHLRRIRGIHRVRPYSPVVVRGIVSSMPRTIQGGHVILAISDSTGSVDCAAYEPTKEFRNVVRRLIPGDMVEVYGGGRPAFSARPLTINLEKIRIMRLGKNIVHESPFCRNCGKRMKSMGRSKGYRCPKCGQRDPKAEKLLSEVERDISLGLHIPPPRAQRHLTKPLSRYGIEKTGLAVAPREPWHYP